MNTDGLRLGFSYLRLSDEESLDRESESIDNQRMIVTRYCEQHGITLVREFVDDGWSGGNFVRPAFQKMLTELEAGQVTMVLTKDLSRLGRDMRESSYYAEQFFPEHGIEYVAIIDNFDSEQENVMAPFMFAMNEVYLRDGSRKVRTVLKHKREEGQYCACPPYGYKKDPTCKGRLIPDEVTAPVVRRIFEQAAAGDSSRKIALDLDRDGAIPPLKYRVLYRDNFSQVGASRASDMWNYTTVKRILKNPVYLGDTLLGKSKMASVKSKVKVPIPKDKWAITRGTHEPLVSETLFRTASENLARGTSNYRAYDHVRKSIFSGVVFCSKCGHALCSCGTVYKGEREKYWYLSCTKQRQDIQDPCDGVRIRYADLVEIVRADLNSLLNLTDTQMESIVDSVIRKSNAREKQEEAKRRIAHITARLETINKIIPKLYADNANGQIDDAMLRQFVGELTAESKDLRAERARIESTNYDNQEADNYQRLFELTRQYTHIDALTPDILRTFVQRIEVGPKQYPDGIKRATHRNTPFSQTVKIYYKFVGEIDKEMAAV